MNLILEASIINPPTMLGSFRDLTFFASKFHPKYDVLLHCNHNDVDLYYHYLKNYIGGLDFISDFIYDKEEGLYLAGIDRITPETLPSILQTIGFKFK